MAFLKKLCNVRANSLLESVIALSIISICLYVAVMVYSAVFTPHTSARFYTSQNKIYEAFFLQQVSTDSLSELYANGELTIDEEDIENSYKKIVVKYKDSTQAYPAKSFYVANE